MLFRQIGNATALVDFPSYNTGKKLDAEIKNLSSVVDNFMQKISVVTFRRTWIRNKKKFSVNSLSLFKSDPLQPIKLTYSDDT